MARGKKTGGRQLGSKNRATIQREVEAQQIVDAARTGEVELGKDVLNRMMKLCEGAAAQHRPSTQAEIEAGAKARGDWGLFGDWVDRTVFCAKELAKYQSPTFKAVAVVPSQMPPPPAMSREGNVIQLHDPLALQRVYRNVMAGAAKKTA